MKVTSPKTATSTQNSLNAKDIVLLIKVAKTSGLTHFRYENLEFSFKTEQKADEITQNMAISPTIPVTQAQKPAPIPEEDFLHDLMLADPAGYEEEIERRLAASEDVA